jgi:hypothetical protein
VVVLASVSLDAQRLAVGCLDILSK